MRKKYFIAVCILLIFVLFLGACDKGPGEETITEDQKGSLTLDIKIPDKLLRAEAASVLDYLYPDNIRITLSKGNETIQEDIDFTEESIVSVAFDDLTTGKWDIDVSITETDSDGIIYDLFAGSEKVTIGANATSEVDVSLFMVPADIIINFYDIGDVLSEATITLKDFSNGDNVRVIEDFSEDEIIVEFNDVPAGSWDIDFQFILLDGTTFSGTEVADILPGRVNSAIIDEEFFQGELDIEFFWGIPLEAPYGLSARMDNENIVLEWQDDYEEHVLGYSVYRSDSFTGNKTRISPSLINETTYTDTDVSEGNEYWYWVRSQQSYGLSSDLSTPTSIIAGEEVDNQAGVLKLINSWGEYWGPNDDGSLYITYEAAIQNEVEFYLFEPRSNYEPKALAVFEIEGEDRGDWEISIEAGDKSKYFYDGVLMRYLREHFPDEEAQYYAKGGQEPFPGNKIVLDITELLPFNNETIKLKVDNGSSSDGVVKSFAIEVHDTPNSVPDIYTSIETPVNVAAGAVETLSIENLKVDSQVSFSARASDTLSNFVNISGSSDLSFMQQEGSKVGNEIVDGYGTGLKSLTNDELEKIIDSGILRQIDSQKVLAAYSSTAESVDYSTSQYFPPIGDQAQKGSCVAWSMAYYMQTFYEARERDWDLSSFDGSKIMSPQFTYHLINDGVDKGSYYTDAMQIIENVGVSSWDKMPYTDAEHTSWPDEDAFREAPLYRSATINEDPSLYQIVVDDMDDIEAIKSLLDAGYLLSASIDAEQYGYLTSNGVWTVENYIVNQTNHANTVVGFDDDFTIIP